MKDYRVEFCPDFFVVGAAKSGTTAVYHWLRGHPGVFLPDTKEPGYFAFQEQPAVPANGLYDPDYTQRVTVEIDSYRALYAAAGDRLTGDVSPVYLQDENAARRIASANPAAKIIVLLRDPVDRAYSQFLHHVRDSLEEAISFEQALDLELPRTQQGWSWGHKYAANGHYAEQIARYLEVFPKEQILFIEFCDLQSKPAECWRQICDHLGLHWAPLLRNRRVNVSRGLDLAPSRPGISHVLRHPGRLQTLIKKLMPSGFRTRLRRVLEGKGRAVPGMTPLARQSLASAYAQERKIVEEMTGLDLAHWTSNKLR